MKLRFLSFVCAAAFFTSCGGGSETTSEGTTTGESTEATTLTGDIKIDGSSTVYPISAGVAEYFMEEYEDVNVMVSYSGTGGGFKKFCVGETDINDASRPIKDKEIKIAEENKIGYQEFSVAYDGLAVVINKENDFIDKLTTEELKAIWENKGDDNAQLWSDIREGFPAEKINLYGPGDASGTYDYFNEVIIGKEGSSRSDYNSSENDAFLVKGVADDKFALGYFGLAYYEENKDKLNLVAIDNGNGEAIKPSLETVMDKSYSPLSRPIFIYLSTATIVKPEVQKFAEFYFDNVNEISKIVGYIPLPADELAGQKQLLADFIAKK